MSKLEYNIQTGNVVDTLHAISAENDRFKHLPRGVHRIGSPYSNKVLHGLKKGFNVLDTNMKYIYLFSFIFFLGCESIQTDLSKTKKSFNNFTFYDDKNHSYTLNTFYKKSKNTNKYILLVESKGGFSALEEEPCGKIAKMSFPETAKYCYQMETASSILAPYKKIIIIDAFEYSHSSLYAKYQVKPKSARRIRGNHKGFRVTLLNSKGKIVKQSNKVIWPDTLYKLIGN